MALKALQAEAGLERQAEADRAELEQLEIKRTKLSNEAKEMNN